MITRGGVFVLEGEDGTGKEVVCGEGGGVKEE